VTEHLSDERNRACRLRTSTSLVIQGSFLWLPNGQPIMVEWNISHLHH